MNRFIEVEEHRADAASAEVESLRAWTHHLRAALDQVEEAVFITEGSPLDADGPPLVFCNRAACRLTSVRAEELPGTPLAGVFESERLAWLLRRLPMVVDSGRTARLRAGLLKGDGSLVPGRWTIRGTLGPGGELLNFTLTFREDPEPPVESAGGVAASSEGELPGGGESEDSGDSVAAAVVEGEGDGDGNERAAPEDPEDGAVGHGVGQKSRTEMLAFIARGIAHDFNNLLTPVLANLSWLEHDLGDGAAGGGRVREARAAVREAQALAKQILDFEKGRASARRCVDLRRLLRESSRLATTGANVRCDLALPEQAVCAWVDPSQAINVFNNLLINARQAMPDGGVIQASLGVRRFRRDEDAPGNLAGGRYAVISVRDRGCGIPESDLESVFRAFFTTKPDGTGVGLATCREIVREHGGEIVVWSKVDVGSEFQVFLPLSDEADESEGAGPAGESDAGGGPESVIPGDGEGTVLVVDDQDAIRLVAAAIIERLGYEALVARDGEEALRIYRERLRSGRPVSVVLLDMTLPGGMSGMETLEELMKLDPGVRTIASSGYFDEDALASHRARGYVGVLPKPYTVERLSREVHDALTVRRPES